MKKAFFISLVLGIFLLSGCSQIDSENVETREGEPSSEEVKDYQKLETENNSDDTIYIKSNEIIFDSCNKINNYEKNSWYSHFNIALDKNNIVIDDILEICLSLDEDKLIAITAGSYCESGIIFQYNILENTIVKAIFNDHERGCVFWPNEFGNRNGDIISLQGFSGDAGCSGAMYYDYNYIDNIIELKKECSQCQKEQEVCQDY